MRHRERSSSPREDAAPETGSQPLTALRQAAADRARRAWLVRASAAVLATAATPARAGRNPAPEHPRGRYRLALALGGGCIRAFAHVGAIKALERGGVRPDLIVGTSAGSMVGALYAGGLNGERLEAAAKSLSWDMLQDWRLSKFGIYGLEPLRDLVNRETAGKRIEQFPMRFAAVATDLQSGKLTVLDKGEPGVCVMASASVPGLVRPTTLDGREYIDGGVVCPVPVRVARALGAETVIGIDVSYPPEEAVLGNAVDVALQAFTIATRHIGHEDLAQADVVIAPRIGPLSNMSLDNNPALIAAGEQAAQRALPAVRAALARAATRR